MQVAKHEWDSHHRCIVVPGQPIRRTEKWSQMVMKGVTVSREEHVDIEAIELWKIGGADRGLFATNRTGAVYPIIDSYFYRFPVGDDGQADPPEVRQQRRGQQAANCIGRLQYPVQGIIGLPPDELRCGALRPEGAGRMRGDHIAQRQEWSRLILRPDNMRAFLNAYRRNLGDGAKDNGLGLDNFDFKPILDRLERPRNGAAKNGQTHEVDRLTRVIQRATADLLCIRHMYTHTLATMQGSGRSKVAKEGQRKADALWELFSVGIPAAWADMEYDPQANIQELNKRVLDISRG